MIIEKDKELQVLKQDFELPHSSFNFIFGRGSTGKTLFINEYIKNKNSFYYCFPETISYLLLNSLKEHFNKCFSQNIDTLNNFNDFLEKLSKLEFKEKQIIVFDDFQNLLKLDKNALSDFYKLWQKSLSNKNFQFIILSSNKSSNDDDLYIYNKATNIIDLESLKFNHLKKLLPNAQKQDLIFIYSGFGTNWKYLKYYDVNKDFLTNVKENILYKDSPLFNEGFTVLKKDLSDIGTYCAILYAISKGNKKVGDIANFLNLKSTYLTRYIQKLLDLMIIRKEVPINDTGKKSKFGRYEIEDNFIRFWFCFVYPNISSLSNENTYETVKQIKEDFSTNIVSLSYKEHIYNLVYQDPYRFLGFIPRKIGKWWNNKDDVIDIVAYDSKNIIFCDCIWKNEQSISLSYSKLKNKAKGFKTPLSKKFIIFSKNSSKEN